MSEQLLVPRHLDPEAMKEFYMEHWTGRTEDFWEQLMNYIKAQPAPARRTSK